MTRPPNPDNGRSAPAGLWIRVAANLSRRKVTWRMVEACLATFPIPDGAPRSLYQKAAIGFLVTFWGNVAEHTADGRVDNLPDGQLEQWAEWDGVPGAFAGWLRAAHLDGDTGKCREWDELQGVLTDRRAADAARQRRKRELDKLANGPIDEVDLGEGATSSTTAAVPSTVEPFDLGHVAAKITIAANRGMHDNPEIGEAYNPIIATRGDGLETVEAWAKAGLTDWKLVASIVYTIAKRYKPTKRGDYIRALTFFRERTITVYTRHMEKLAAAAGTAPGEVSIDAKAERPTAQTKAARTGAGAHVAAKSAGLPDE